MRRFVIAAGATAALVVSLMSGCSSGAETGSKAGGEAAPITLRVGTDDGPGRPAADQISEFARQVEQLSEGAIIIEPALQADGPQHRSWDQLVARMVVSGELDMGMIPARAWDTEGVTSLRALHAPFLVDTEEFMAKVVSADVAADMLAGLDVANVTGLALVPESMRQVFSFGEPLLTPEQFKGITIRAPLSDTTNALFEALGATVIDAQGDEFSDGVSSGTIVGAEASFVLAGSLPSPAVGTGNLTLFPKVNSLVINSGVFAGLNETQQTILRQAADATREWAIEQVVESPAAAIEYCANGGGTAVVTSVDNVAAFKRAAEPVYVELESDPSTKEFIQRLRDLKTNSPAPIMVTPCVPPAAAPTTTVPGDAPSDFPEGSYRTEMSGAAGLAAGLAPDTANAMDGINTLTFNDGQFLHDIKRDQPDQCHGTYTVESGRLVVALTDCGAPPGGRPLFSATWTFDGTTLILNDVRADFDPHAQALWGDHVWTRIDEPALVEPEFPAGVYRTQLTSEELLAGGLDKSTANGLDGIQTLSFDNGTWVHYGVARGPGECTGSYAVTGGRLIVTIAPRCGGSLGVLFSAAWTVDGAGVTFTDVRSDTDSQAFASAVWGGGVWERIA